MHATDVQNPWDTVAIALDGPLPRSNEGNTWLLVMQDRFTKWVEIKPLRKASARAIVTAFKDLIVMRFGCPREVVSDNGGSSSATNLQICSKNMASLTAAPLCTRRKSRKPRYKNDDRAVCPEEAENLGPAVTGATIRVQYRNQRKYRL